MRPDEIWDEHLKAGMPCLDGPSGGPLSRDFSDDYAEGLLSRLRIGPDETVLDVGCGDGAVAVRLAGRARFVTALDADPSLIVPLTRRALGGGVTNLRFVNADWFQVEIGGEIPPHDVVLASRFRRMTPLRVFLERMSRAAMGRCYLTWMDGRDDPAERIRRAAGMPERRLPDWRLIVATLEDMGFEPRAELFESHSSRCYDGPAEAAEDALRAAPPGDDGAVGRAVAAAEAELERGEDGWRRHVTTRWALIGWEK